MQLIYKIHASGLESIKKGTLKNGKIIDFINMDLYFLESKYAKKVYRPLAVVQGLDFEEMTDEFFKKWEESNIFKIYSFADYDFKSEIVDQVKEMKHFGKLLKLFNYKNKQIFDLKLIKKLREKFKNILNTYTAETCPKFKEEIAYFIYIIDYQKFSNLPSFMTDTIERYIPSAELKTDIYIYLATNYKDISQDAINTVTDFLTKNKDRLNAKSILFILEKINSQKIIESLLNKIESFSIKEKELFNPEKDIESFQLLDGIQKGGLLDKLQFEDLNKTKYLMNALKTKDIILDKIKKGEVYYNSIIKIWLPKNRDVFQNKLRILFFNNEKDVEESMKILNEKKTNVFKEIQYINQLLQILREFFENQHKNNIIKVEQINKTIKTGMLNEIDKKETKESIDKMNSIMPKADLDKKFKLKKSIFFTHFFKAKKANNILKKEEDIFTETEQDFNKLKPFFEDNWIEKIDEVIIKECYRALKNKSDKNIKEELKFLRDNFNLKEKDDLYIEKLQDDIKIFSQKEEIFQTINSCLHFISEFHAKPTDFNTLLIQLKKDLSGNISVKKIKEYGKSLEKYGINILNPKVEDKDYLNILTALFSKKGSLSFIMSLTDEDCRTLQELVSESESTFLTGAEIQDMTKCSNFIHSMNITKDLT